MIQPIHLFTGEPCETLLAGGGLEPVSSAETRVLLIQGLFHLLPNFYKRLCSFTIAGRGGAREGTLVQLAHDWQSFNPSEARTLAAKGEFRFLMDGASGEEEIERLRLEKEFSNIHTKDGVYHVNNQASRFVDKQGRITLLGNIRNGSPGPGPSQPLIALPPEVLLMEEVVY